MAGHRLRTALWIFAFSLLLIPLIAMRYSDQVNWTASDFAFAMVMIGGVGGAYELAVRTSPSWAYRAGAAMALAAVFLLIWINAAVGIVGDEANPWNLMFSGVIIIALIGAIVVRFRAEGMVWVMVAAALLQLLAGAIAIISQLGMPAKGTVELAGLMGFFGMLWLNAAWLFRQAARGA